MRDTFASFQNTTLDNGLRIFAAHWDRPWIKVAIVVHAGARDDPAGTEGLAHFAEHIVTVRSDKDLVPDMVARMEKVGGRAKLGSTHYAYTDFAFAAPLDGKSPKRAFNAYGKILLKRDMARSIEKERRIILSEYDAEYPFPWISDLSLRRRKALFHTGRIARFNGSIGNREVIARIQKNDLRIFLDAFYVPQNMSVIVVGGIKIDALKKMIAQSPFGKMIKGKRNAPPQPLQKIDLPSETRVTKPMGEISTTKIQESTIESYAAIPGTICEGAIAVAVDVLRAVLKQELREHDGDTYGFKVTFHHAVEAYEIIISGNFPWRALSKIERRINDCIALAAKNTKLIRRHIAEFEHVDAIVDFDGNEMLAYAVDELSQRNHMQTPTEKSKAYAQLRVSEIQNIFPYLTPNRRWTFLITR